MGFWPSEAVKLLDDVELEDFKYLSLRSRSRFFDNRLDAFLESFTRDGWFWVRFFFLKPGTKWYGYNEQIPATKDTYCTLVIKDGYILNREEIPNILDILDTAGITNALPPFNGNELEPYTIDDNGN